MIVFSPKIFKGKKGYFLSDCTVLQKNIQKWEFVWLLKWQSTSYCVISAYQLLFMSLLELSLCYVFHKSSTFQLFGWVYFRSICKKSRKAAQFLTSKTVLLRWPRFGRLEPNDVYSYEHMQITRSKSKF